MNPSAVQRPPKLSPNAALVNIRRRAKRLRRERLIARGELPKEALNDPLSEEETDQTDENTGEVGF